MTAVPKLSAASARRLLLDAQGLLANPARRATSRTVEAEVRRLGFVQIDTINVVERAHHHILHTRFDGYRPELLTRLLERERALFEHWTHDASVIRADWLPWWRHRFDAFRKNARAERWIRQRIGPDHERVVRHVWRRITRDGPLMSRDFEDAPNPDGSGWWRWKPKRAALELLWRVGKLSVAGRVHFHKVYDRTDRVFPEASRQRKPSPAAHRDWACRSALAHLGVAEPIELARVLLAVDVAAARSWAARAERRGEVVRVEVESADGSPPRTAYAPADWEKRVERAADPPERLRLLNPFEPAIHDRTRTLRRFGFDYRLECFVPAARRRYGYYVLPILEGERLVGRLDPKLDRRKGVLAVRRVWWEPGVRPTRARARALEAGLDLLARQVGADRFELPPRPGARAGR